MNERILDHSSVNSIKVSLVNSFTLDGKGGNPAGVVLNSRHLSDTQKQNIAKTIGYSETAFVQQCNEERFDVTFYTPTSEVDFCGHATLAVFHTLLEKKVIKPGRYTQHTKAGIVPIQVAESGLITMQQQCPEKLGRFNPIDVADLLSLDSDVIESTQLPCEVISTGLADLIVPVPFGYLDKVTSNSEKMADFCEKNNIVGLHVFELTTNNNEKTASCRNFAPLFGIEEESATGSACGALTCYLAENIPSISSEHYIFEQGRAMGCCSEIRAKLSHDSSGQPKVLISGKATNNGEKILSLDT